MECENSHEFLLNKENLVQCPFCDEQLTDVKSVETRCCNKPNITVDGFKQLELNQVAKRTAALSTGLNRRMNLWIFMRIDIG